MTRGRGDPTQPLFHEPLSQHRCESWDYTCEILGLYSYMKSMAMSLYPASLHRTSHMSLRGPPGAPPGGACRRPPARRGPLAAGAGRASPAAPRALMGCCGSGGGGSTAAGGGGLGGIGAAARRSTAGARLGIGCVGAAATAVGLRYVAPQRRERRRRRWSGTLLGRHLGRQRPAVASLKAWARQVEGRRQELDLE
jgi:hypothetical protein